MLDFFIVGLQNAIQPSVLIWVLVGAIISTFLGIIPVLGGELGVVILLPFIIGLDPMISLPFLLAVDAVSCTAGSITSILLNVPGSLINVATCFDGYPLTQKGEGSRAIGAALTSSCLGGIITVPMALIMIPILVPFILLCRSPEMFLLILIGISCMSVLVSKGSVLKGLISSALGLLFSCIGVQGETGLSRFTFGFVNLYDGIPLTDMVLAMFAIPSLVTLFAKRTSIAPPTNLGSLGDMRQLWVGARDVFIHRWLFLKSAVIGYIIGVIPGIGAFTSTFMTYGLAKKSSKTPEEFGKGAIEGVIAPEAANNAKEAGSLLTTMAFGIPGSGTMAIMLAAFLIAGIQPGPGMLINNTALCITMLASIVMANIFAVVIVWFGVPVLIKVTRINYSFIFALIVPIIYLGAFANGETLFDIFAVAGFGALGVCMQQFGYSAPALILGFVLGRNLEYYLWKSLDTAGIKSFVSSPTSLLFLTICIGLLFNKPLGALFRIIRKKL